MSSLLPIIDAGLPTGIVEPFSQRVSREGRYPRRSTITDLQINLGKLCNQTCTHCHVEAGPTRRRENMDARTAQRIADLVAGCGSIRTVDLTGGAPEMNSSFRFLVTTFRSRGLRVIDRCNLTILSEPGFEWVGQFLADHHVDVVASLPCYLQDNVDMQRGSGVFRRSIDALLRLNELGYAQPGSSLRLDLVFNPTGPSLPPDQAMLEADYKRELSRRYSIEFDRLLSITNIPIKRYARYLLKKGKLDEYMRLLAENYNGEAADRVMCRSLISIGWEGAIYDCDFNQMLGMPAGGVPQTVWTIDSFGQFENGKIAVADHCYGCTAGAGSGCGGAIVPSNHEQRAG